MLLLETNKKKLISTRFQWSWQRVFSFSAIDSVADVFVSGLCILLDRQPVLYSLLSAKETVSSHVMAITINCIILVVPFADAK